jgi:hypothetical protein
MRGGHSSMTLCLVGNNFGCKGELKRRGRIRCICCIVILEKIDCYHFFPHRLHSVRCLCRVQSLPFSKARPEPIKSFETVAWVKQRPPFLP